MKVQVTVTRTETGANTKVKSDSGESSKEYPSWDAALTDAEQLGLINSLEAVASKALPPGFPLHANGEVEASTFTSTGFTEGKTSPPQ